MVEVADFRLSTEVGYGAMYEFMYPVGILYIHTDTRNTYEVWTLKLKPECGKENIPITWGLAKPQCRPTFWVKCIFVQIWLRMSYVTVTNIRYHIPGSRWFWSSSVKVTRRKIQKPSYKIVLTLPVSAVPLNIPLNETRHFPPRTTPLPSWCVKIIRYSFWWTVSATGGYKLVAYAQLGCAFPSIALLLKFKPNSTSEGKRWEWRKVQWSHTTDDREGGKNSIKNKME